MEQKKVTKRNVLAAIRTLVEGANDEIRVDDVIVTENDILDYVDITIAQLEAKSVKAKERAAEKRAEGDALMKEIEGVLTSDLQTIPQIIEVLDIEDLTPGKVAARLTTLIKAGRAHKEKIKSNGRTLNGYAVGPASESESEAE